MSRSAFPSGPGRSSDGRGDRALRRQVDGAGRAARRHVASTTEHDGEIRRFVAVHDRFGASLHWSVYQAEWATDIVFKDDRLLPDLYAQIVRTACAIRGSWTGLFTTMHAVGW